MTCSLLWVRCLFDQLSISAFRDKWPHDPKSENFRKCLSGFLDGMPNYVSSPNLVKISCCKVADRSRGLPHKKTLALWDSSLPPFCPKWADRAQNSWTLSTLDMSMYTEFGPDWLRFTGLIPERLIFRHKKSIQYRLSGYNNSKTMFMVLSSWQSHCESSPGSLDECTMAPSGRRPSDRAKQHELWVRL